MTVERRGSWRRRGSRRRLGAFFDYAAGKANFTQRRKARKVKKEISLFQVGVAVQTLFVEAKQGAGFFVADPAFADGGFYVGAELF